MSNETIREATRDDLFRAIVNEKIAAKHAKVKGDLSKISEDDVIKAKEELKNKSFDELKIIFQELVKEKKERIKK